MELALIPISRVVSRDEWAVRRGETTSIILLPLVGDVEPLLWPTEMLLLALAAPVLADSKIFLKNPCFLVLGVERPPNTPPESPASSFAEDQGIADEAPWREVLWLEW
jgi:hypothetical protein